MLSLLYRTIYYGFCQDVFAVQTLQTNNPYFWWIHEWSSDLGGVHSTVVVNLQISPFRFFKAATWKAKTSYGDLMFLFDPVEITPIHWFNGGKKINEPGGARIPNSTLPWWLRQQRLNGE